MFAVFTQPLNWVGATDGLRVQIQIQHAFAKVYDFPLHGIWEKTSIFFIYECEYSILLNDNILLNESGWFVWEEDWIISKRKSDLHENEQIISDNQNLPSFNFLYLDSFM